MNTGWNSAEWRLPSGRTRLGWGGLHPDTVDWLIRVKNVGGSVSDSTIIAADDFGRAIYAAGLRSSIARLNLFCGNNLTTALVPFYVGYTRGQVFGNATDTNVNFVAGDYVETGATGGLVGNGSSKFLSTGLTGSAASMLIGSHHVGVYLVTASSPISDNCFIGARDSSTNGFYFVNNSVPSTRWVSQSATAFWGSQISGSGLLLGQGSSGTTITLRYKNVQRASSSAAGSSPATATNGFNVFALGDAGAPLKCNARLGGYCLGIAIPDFAAYDAAWVAFAAALGRPTS